MIFHTIPFMDRANDKEYPLLVVLPIAQQSKDTGGLVLPETMERDYDEGTVVFAGKHSIFKTGDIVVYNKLDRTQEDRAYSFCHEGEVYDIIGEAGVWNVNEKPFDRIYVLPISNLSVDKMTTGLLMPEKTDIGIQRGLVMNVPDNFYCKKGDTIEYRHNTKKIYSSVIVGDQSYDVLFAPDIYTINGKVNPYRIMVKIDMRKQRIKRQGGEEGMMLSPAFIGMKHNLQYVEVVEIGAEAQKDYPLLSVGDTAIVTHSLEEQPHRLLKQEYTSGELIYEYRMLECFNPRAREVFGTINTVKYKRQLAAFGKNVFLNWTIKVWGADETILDTDISLSRSTSIPDLRYAIKRAGDGIAKLFKSKFAGYQADMERLRYDNEEEQPLIAEIGRKIDALKYEATKLAAYSQKDYVIEGTDAITGERVMTQYKILYEIELFGSKYIIAHSDYILCTINNNNEMKPIGSKVFVEVIDDTKESLLIVPDSAMEKPQTGRVTAIGKDIDPEEINVGQIVAFRRNTGVELKGNDINLLVLHRDHIFAAN